jgi:hypothetical protein
MRGNCDSVVRNPVWLVCNAVLAILILMASGSMCFGQATGSPHTRVVSKITRSVATQTQLFPPPELETHELPVRPDDVNTQPTRQAQVFSSQVDSVNDPRSALFRQIEKEGSLKSPEPVPNSETGRKVANAFRPEILHVGHVRIYSPLVTAIARKNPLCLLDPMVLGISF